MNYRAYHSQWMKWHKRYELKAYRIIKRRLRDKTLEIPFDKVNQYNFIVFLEMYLTKDFFNEMFLEIYQEIGLVHGKRVGKFINKQINEKDFTADTFTNEFLINIQRYLLGKGGSHITSVRKTYVDYIMQTITEGFNESKTLQEVTRDLTRLLRSRNFYRYQAFRIARTETTSASNYSAYMASNNAGVAMDKVWISALDKRTRRTPPDKFDHYHMNGVKVALDQPFNVDGEKLMFPGDQENGSAGNVINCRCTVAQVVRRDANGNIVRLRQ